MKLTNRQKNLIQKSLKLNEDFFDDKQLDIYDEAGFDLENQQYTYHFQFIFHLWPLIKHIDEETSTYEYYFENQKYKPIIETAFISIKKVLDYILQATPIVTDYSKPKFCSSYEKIIKIFPFMNNMQSNEYEIPFSDKHFITLKTSINISGRKNTHNIIKLLCSFWRLQQIYNKILNIKSLNINMRSPLYINIGIDRNNPYKKTNLYPLMQTDGELASTGLELINFLNNKDETDE